MPGLESFQGQMNGDRELRDAFERYRQREAPCYLLGWSRILHWSSTRVMGHLPVDKSVVKDIG